MAYQSPTIREVGTVRGLTLGHYIDVNADDDIWVYGPGGSKVVLPIGDGS